MYLAQNVIARIDSALKSKGISKIKMCTDLGINKNTINSMTDKKGMSSFDLAKIADYLGVSVDYLLGRQMPENFPQELLRQNTAEEIAEILSSMSDEDLKQAKSYIKYLAEQNAPK